ncbi:MAG: homing endonuclease associated repeat-containing protein [Pirellulaceae bacterium]
MASDNFKLARVSGQPVSDEELLADLRRVAETLGSSTVSMPKYREYGQYDDSNLAKRFGTWNNALINAGLSISNEVNISDERLFENILALWQHCGRQPRRSELAKPPSIISQGPYKRRFNSWTAALGAFVEYANASAGEAPVPLEKGVSKPRTGRDPSLRLRWHVLQRDRFTCCACGASPALSPGVELHVDHIVPWNRDGETVLEDLQTLCSVCNLGKSNT